MFPLVDEGSLNLFLWIHHSTHDIGRGTIYMIDDTM